MITDPKPYTVKDAADMDAAKRESLTQYADRRRLLTKPKEVA